MNALIKKLALAAGAEVTGYRDQELSLSNFDLNKFAELIVWDCCNVVLHYTNVDEGVEVAKMHFGVEK